MSDHRTWLASILFMDIVGYSKLTVNHQVEVKQHFLDKIEPSVRELDASDSILVDTGDGLALCFLGDPEKIFPVANEIRDLFRAGDSGFRHEYEVRLGLNLGPVKLVEDINGKRNCLGAGINDAQRVMDFAAPNQLLVSKSYFDVVSKISNYYASRMSYEGVRVDKHDCGHEVYLLDEGEFDASDITVIGMKSMNVEVGAPVMNKLELDPKVEEHLLRELSSYIGRAAAEQLMEDARYNATSLKELCKQLTSQLEGEDNRYEFESFTRYYGYSGY